MNNNGFKETDNFADVEKALKEMRKSWADICDAFGVDPEIPLQPEVLRNNIRATLIDLNELENMDYVKKSGKPLEKLHETYLKCLIQSVLIHVETDDSQVWKEEVQRYVRSVITEDLIDDIDIQVSSEQLLTDIQRVFSISNQLNIIRGMESGNVSPEMFMSLEDNFIYLNIGIIQTCNGNAVIMGKVVSFIKALIKINDNILKSISQMLSR